MSVYIPVDLQRQLRDDFANCCAYCRTAEDLTVAIFEFEHIIPRSAGGKTVFKNLCLACPTCNRFKADRTAAPDPTTQKKALLFHPQRDVWTDHFAWTEDASEITGLTSTGRVPGVRKKSAHPWLSSSRSSGAESPVPGSQEPISGAC